MKLLRQKKLLVLAALFVALMTTGLGCKGGDRAAQNALKEPVVLDVWGVFDSQDAFAGVIAEYNTSRPNVTINYRKLQFAEYESALLNAWAEGRGPDIIMVHNTWVGGYTNKIVPLPETLQVPKQTSDGTAILPVSQTITPSQVKDLFVPVVHQDAIRDGLIYGLPLSVDTLALYYNRTLFDQSSVFAVPKTWQEVIETSKKITRYDDEGNIVRSGIALGGSANINRSFDIVSLLMAQNGTEFVDPTGRRATFSQASKLLADSRFRPGEEAVRFYTDFAHPGKETYTWTENFPSAQQQFISGSLGMMLGYSYQIPFLRAQGPKVDFGISTVPHINADGSDAVGQSVNWANYWLLSVAQSSDNQEHAWDFIHSISTQPDVARSYLDSTQKPAALRSLVAEQVSEPERGIFASQLLTAQSWYQGLSAVTAEQVFGEMIADVVEGRSTPRDAVQRAAEVVTPTLN